MIDVYLMNWYECKQWNLAKVNAFWTERFDPLRQVFHLHRFKKYLNWPVWTWEDFWFTQVSSLSRVCVRQVLLLFSWRGQWINWFRIFLQGDKGNGNRNSSKLYCDNAIRPYWFGSTLLRKQTPLYDKYLRS